MHVLHGKFILDRDGTSPIHKVLTVPYQEGIYGPDVAAVVLPAGKVGIQKIHQGIRVEKLLRLTAEKGLPDNIVIFFLAQPDADRNRKSQFLFLRCCFGHIPVGRLPECSLGIGVADLLAQRQILGDIEYAAVQEGHAALQAVRHAHLVRFEEYIALQPEIEINILHFLRIGEGPRLLVKGCGQSFGFGVRGGVFKDLVPLIHRENIGVADETLLHRPCPPHEEAFTLGMSGNLRHHSSSRPAHSRRQLLVLL